MKLLNLFLFNFSLFVAKSATKPDVKIKVAHNKKSTFGDVSKETNVSKVDSNINFSNFLKNFQKKTVLKLVGKNYLGFSNKTSIHLFNIKNNKHTTVIFKDINRTDKINCFCCDSKYIYVKFRKYLRVFDHNGNEITNYNFKNREISGMDIYVDKNCFYLISHNKEILGFRLDSSMKHLNLIFYNNDFYSSKLGKFNFIIGQDIYILNGKKLSVVHKLSGKVLKNNYLDYYFENIILLKNNIFLYGKERFVFMDLSDFSVVYNNKIELFESTILVDTNGVKFGSKFYEGLYLYTYFFNGMFFRYSQNTYDSRCFLIKKGDVSEFILENFAVSHVFNSEDYLILVDIKLKKIKLF